MRKKYIFLGIFIVLVVILAILFFGNKKDNGTSVKPAPSVCEEEC